MVYRSKFLSSLVSITICVLILPAASFGSAADVREVAKFEPEFPIIEKRRERTPDGAWTKPISAACDPHALEDRLLGSAMTNREMASDFQKFIDQCESEFGEDFPHALIALDRLLRLNYNWHELRFAKRVLFTLESGVKRRAMLLTRPGKIARPLVIVNSGVRSVLNDGSVRELVAQVFDVNNFHVLALANTTGGDYAADNGMIAMGGLEEGHQLIEMAQLLKSKFKDRMSIASVHLIGGSLGGNGVLMASAVDQLYSDLMGTKPEVQSVVGVCPLVNMENNLDYLEENSFRRSISRFMVDFEMETYGHYYLPELQEIVKRGMRLTARKAFPFIAELTYATYKNRLNNPKVFKAPWRETRLSGGRAYYQMNNFINYLDRVKTPIIMWSAMDDKVVPPEVNAITVDQSGRRPANMQTIYQKQGGHCAFSQSIGWHNLATFARINILNHSKKYLEQAQMKEIELIIGPQVPAWLKETRPRWSVDKDQNYLTLEWISPGKGQYRYSEQVPMMRFGKESSLFIAKTDAEAQMLTRWANLNLRVLPNYEDKNSTPVTIAWRSWDK